MFDVPKSSMACALKALGIQLLSENVTGYILRGAVFHIPRFHSVTYGKHSLSYLGPKLWNSLPSNLRK